MSPSPLDPVARALADYALKVGDDVDVDLLIGTEADGRAQPVTVEGRGFFARCLQHETDHLDGHVYTDRLIGRNKRAAKRAVRANGWGVPGITWMPGVDPDPFGH